MAERKQTFRFRMPWQPVAQAPRPTVEQTPTQPTAAPASEPTTAAPAQRPPFRPPGLAPSQPTPPQVQASTRTESQTPSPSRANTQVQVTSQPQSPSGATQSQAASQPTPPPAAPQPQTASQPSSLSLTASQTQPVPQPQSQAQQTERAVNQPPSPSEKLQPTTQESSQPPPSSTEPPPSVFQQETNPTESQPKTENTSENVLNSQNQTSIQTNFSPNGTATQPSEVSGPIAAPAPTQKVNSSVATAEPNPLPESDENPEKTEEGKEIVQDLRKEGKINGIAYEEPKQRTDNEVFTVSSESKSAAKEQPSFTFQAKQKQQEKQTKTAIPFPHLKDKNTVREASFRKEIREDVSELVQKMATGNPKHPITMDEKPVSVITLAGENRGASMQLGSESSKREGTIHIYRGYKTNPDETSEATTDGEGTSKERKSKNPNTIEDQARKAYINNNIQSLNNSIVFNSPVTERNPGVSLILSRKPAEPMIKSNNRTESRRAEFNITPSQMLTYEPIVKRRCLRGLFMESSDSDPDNPEKPRRHGCRYDCGKKSKDTQIDVL